MYIDFGDGSRDDLPGSASPGERVTREDAHLFGCRHIHRSSHGHRFERRDEKHVPGVTVTGGSGPIGGLMVDLTHSPGVAQAGQQVTFRGSASPPLVLGGTITGMSTHFGDGSRDNLNGVASPGERVTRVSNHSYAAAGTYTAVLTATASNGATGSTSQDVTVTGGAKGSRRSAAST